MSGPLTLGRTANSECSTPRNNSRPPRGPGRTRRGQAPTPRRGQRRCHRRETAARNSGGDRSGQICATRCSRRRPRRRNRMGTHRRHPRNQKGKRVPEIPQASVPIEKEHGALRSAVQPPRLIVPPTSIPSLEVVGQLSVNRATNLDGRHQQEQRRHRNQHRLLTRHLSSFRGSRTEPAAAA